MPLPEDYTNFTTPTGALWELPATGPRGLNTIMAQINAATAALANGVFANGGVFGAIAAAPTGNATTDTAAITAAHTALPSGGGTILLQPGIYVISGAGVTFSKPTQLMGMGGKSNVGGTSLISASSSATILTLTGGGHSVENVMVAIDGSVVPTAGYGIKCTDSTNLRIDNVWFYNLYDCLRLENTGIGAYWGVHRCFFEAPVRYGVFFSNTPHPDTGDGVVSSCFFDAQGAATRNPTSALRWESGGGFRVQNCKINGGSGGKFVTGVDVNMTVNQATADIYVQNCSIENIVGDGIWVRATTGSIWGVLITANEFMASNKAVRIGAGISGCLVDSCIGNGSGATDFTAASPAPTVGTNVWN